MLEFAKRGASRAVKRGASRTVKIWMVVVVVGLVMAGVEGGGFCGFLRDDNDISLVRQ